MVKSNVMQTSELRSKLIEFINQADEKSLQSIFNFVSDKHQQDSDKIVAYDVKGAPITLTQYCEKNTQALQDIKDGKIFTHQEILNRFHIQ